MLCNFASDASDAVRLIWTYRDQRLPVCRAGESDRSGRTSAALEKGNFKLGALVGFGSLVRKQRERSVALSRRPKKKL